MPNLAIRSLIFVLCWAAWCTFAILWLGPEIASHQLNSHTALIAWILCIVPLAIYAVVLIRSSKSKPKT